MLRDLADELTLVLGHAVGCIAHNLLHALYILDQNVLVGNGGGNNVVDNQVTHNASLDLNLLYKLLHLHIVAYGELALAHNTATNVNVLRPVAEHGVHTLGHAGDVGQTTALSLLFPFIGVAVAIEVNGCRLNNEFANLLEDSLVLLNTLGNQSVHVGLELTELSCNN